MICWKTSFKSRVLWVLSLVSLTLFFWATTFGPMRFENYAIHRETSGIAEAMFAEIAAHKPIEEVMVNFSEAAPGKRAQIRSVAEQLRELGQINRIEDLGAVQFAGRKHAGTSAVRHFRIDYSYKRAYVEVSFVLHEGKYRLSGLEVAHTEDRIG